ncbi:LysR family transcriptional regulator [Paenibacillus sp. sgz500958]|uniref:LysR family transcriptional regulator n=1 Tax=Paenibacillus sp. sgz500958 TaxID=3242475 RepID=UPI0036D20EB4
MTLYQIEVFLVVVRNGSFTKAGEELHASQSGVSHIISDLEQELGVTLFSRSRSGVKVTKAGEHIVAHAREIMRQMERIREIAAEENGVQNGILRIASFPSFTANVIPQMIQSFRNHYPNIEILLFEGSYAEVEAWIRAGAVDLGFLSEAEDGIEMKLRILDPLVVVLPANHPLTNHEVISIEQIENEPLILLKSGCERMVVNAFKEKALHLHTQFEAAENSTVISMVEAGMGVSIVPAMILPSSPPKVEIRRLHPPLSREVGLAVLAENPVTPAVHAFIKEAENVFASYQYYPAL